MRLRTSMSVSFFWNYTFLWWIFGFCCSCRDAESSSLLPLLQQHHKSNILNEGLVLSSRPRQDAFLPWEFPGWGGYLWCWKSSFSIMPQRCLPGRYKANWSIIAFVTAILRSSVILLRVPFWLGSQRYSSNTTFSLISSGISIHKNCVVCRYT